MTIELGPVMLDVAGLDITSEEGEIIAHPQVGGVIAFARNYQSPEQLIDWVRQLREVKPHLLIAADHEGGVAQQPHGQMKTLVLVHEGPGERPGGVGAPGASANALRFAHAVVPRCQACPCLQGSRLGLPGAYVLRWRFSALVVLFSKPTDSKSPTSRPRVKWSARRVEQ